MEFKNRAKFKDSESLGQLAERARTLFNVQDTHRYGYTLDSTYQSSMTTSVRFALLICIRLDQFSYTAYDRGGSITSPFVNINTHALLSIASYWVFLLLNDATLAMTPVSLALECIVD
jgi:hypothetical protein